MKKIFIALFVVSFVLINFSVAQEATPATNFHKIVASGKLLVQIVRAENYAVEIKTMEAKKECLINTIEEGILTLKLTSGSGCKGKVVVNVSCPALSEIEISGRAEIATGNVLTGDSMLVTMRSRGKAYIDLDINYLEAKISDGAMARFEGYAVEQAVSVSTSSTFSAWDLEGDIVRVKAASNAVVKVNAQEEIHAVAGSGAYIGIKGDPEKKDIDGKSYGEIEFLSD